LWSQRQLNDACPPTFSGFYLSTATSLTDAAAVMATTLGCTLIPPREDAAQNPTRAWVPSYCCPPGVPPGAQPHTGGGPSCEQVQHEYVRPTALGAPASTDTISVGQYAAVLSRGSYFAHCPVPDSLVISICAAVRNGQAIGVTVSTQPANPRAADCIAEAVVKLAFPSEPELDVIHTQF
jgi:hypothetical protein